MVFVIISMLIRKKKKRITVFVIIKKSKLVFFFCACLNWHTIAFLIQISSIELWIAKSSAF